MLTKVKALNHLECNPSSLVFLTLCGFILSLILGCEEPPQCTSNQDCRDGFVCDLTLFKGECVQEVQVIRCGESLCQYPLEICVNQQCVQDVSGDHGTIPGGNRTDLNLPPDQTPSFWDAQVDQNIINPSDQNIDLSMSSADGLIDQFTLYDRDIPVDQTLPDQGDPLLMDQGGQSCMSNCDCTPGLACIQAQCMALDQPEYCCEHSFCPAGEFCEDSNRQRRMCPSALCDTACDCQPGLGCINQTCILGDEPVFCCQGSTCPSGMQCETQNGRLTLCPSDECQTACDCTPGLSCIGGICQLGEEPLYCCTDQFCPTEQRCEMPNGALRVCGTPTTNQCQTACDCTPGLRCIEGECVAGGEAIYCCGEDPCPLDARCQESTGGPFRLCAR